MVNSAKDGPSIRQESTTWTGLVERLSKRCQSMKAKEERTTSRSGRPPFNIFLDRNMITASETNISALAYPTRSSVPPSCLISSE